MQKIEKPKKRSTKTSEDFYQREIDYYENHFGILVDHFCGILKITPEDFLARLAASDLSSGRGIVEAIYRLETRLHAWFPDAQTKPENILLILNW